MAAVRSIPCWLWSNWVRACDITDLRLDTALRFDHGARTFVLICSAEGDLFCTDGLCTHEEAHLADGQVNGIYIECPLHSGRFDYRTGEARRYPACDDLQTYPVRLDGDDVVVDLAQNVSKQT